MTVESIETAEGLDALLADNNINLAEESEEKDFLDDDSGEAFEPAEATEPAAADDEATIEADDGGSDPIAEGGEDNAPIQSVRDNPEYKAMEARLRKMEGKFGTINAQYGEMTAAQKRLIDEADARQKAAEERRMAAQNEDFSKFQEEDPDLAKFVESQARQVAQDLIKNAGYISKDDLTQTVNSRFAEMTEAENVNRSIAEMDKAHPTWQDDVQSNKFKSWLYSQDDETLALLESDNIDDDMKIMNEYKSYNDSLASQERAQGRKKSQAQRLKSAVSPTKSSAAAQQIIDTEEDDFLNA